MFQQRLKSARKAQALSQAEVAVALGVPQTFISKLELGKKKPSVETLTKLAAIYKVRVADLLGEDDEEARHAGPAALDRHAPQGLWDLAEDEALHTALAISPAEWLALASIALPSPTDKEGYVQLLETIRRISRR